MIITISGKPGSGKGTVGRILAKKLNYPFFSMGDMRRAMAEERGMTLEEFNKLGESQAFTDRQVDEWQKHQGQIRANGIFDGRLSFYFIPCSIKVFLDVDLKEAARRIANDKTNHHRKNEAKFADPASIERSLKRRIKSDSQRYKKYYGVDIFDRRQYDIVIDTTKILPATVAKKIMAWVVLCKRNKVAVHKLVGKSKLSTGSLRRPRTGRKTK